MKTKEMNVIVMAEAVIDVQDRYAENLALVPKGIELNAELKDLIALHHQKNQLLVLENRYAAQKQAKRLLLEAGADEMISQLLLYAVMENKPELKAQVDLCYSDLRRAGGDKLIDISTRVKDLAYGLEEALTPYRGHAITPDGLKDRIIDYTTLLSAPRMDIASRSAINKELKENVVNVRELLNEKMDVAMNLIKNTDQEYFNAYVTARVIVDRRGKRNEKGVEPNATTGMIFGNITDSETGEGLQNVIVELEGVEDATTTDENGDYFFDEVAPGMHNVTCVLDTYQSLELEDISVVAGEETEADGVMLKV